MLSFGSKQLIQCTCTPKVGQLSQLSWKPEISSWYRSLKQINFPFPLLQKPRQLQLQRLWKEMSAYLRWFYSVHLGQHYQEPRGPLIFRFLILSLLLAQFYCSPIIFLIYLKDINHHQVLGLWSLTLPHSPDLVQCLCRFKSRPAAPSCFSCDQEWITILPAGVKHLLDSYSIVAMGFRKGLLAKVFFQLLFFALGICNEWQIMFAFYGNHC